MKRIIIIVLVVLAIMGVCGYYLLTHNSTKEIIDDTGAYNTITTFDVSVISYLDLMPGVESDEAYFIISIEGMDKESYLNKYQMKQIQLNGETISNKNFVNEEGPDDGANGFRLGRFYSSNYKDNNKMIISFLDNETNVLYYKTILFPTETVE